MFVRLSRQRGLHNRCYLWDYFERELLKAKRSGKPLAVIVLDVDHFKRFNDGWGHAAGDLVLKTVANVVAQSIRGSDMACRYGGEEFIAVLPEVTREAAVERAEAIRQAIQRARPVSDGRPLGFITASLGVALYPDHGNDADALVRAADRALYEAKQAGRDRVVISSANPVRTEAA